MKRRASFCLLPFAFCLAASAQPTVAPAQEPVGVARGENVSGYNIVNSFELGYRFHRVDGNAGKYRSDVNFGNGIRLLGSSLTVHSREGRGRLFDEIALQTQGLGNDPYQFSSLRVQKNRIYRYDLLWRLNDYINPALPVAAGEHAIATTRRLQDHDLTLLPQSKLKVFLGYTRNSQSGPALATGQVFDGRGDEFPLFSNVIRLRNEYRLGAEISLFGARFTVLRGWDRFHDRGPNRLGLPNPGNNPLDQTELAEFRSRDAYSGSSPYWRLNLYAERKIWAANGRFTYTAGRRDFLYDELAVGTDRFGAGRNRQIIVDGDARRPVSNGNLTLSVFPNSKVTVSNHTAFHHTRMEGDAFYRELNNATLGTAFLNFRFLGIRAITNTTDLNYRAAKWLGFYTGYHSSTRRIRSIEGEEFAGEFSGLTAEQNNRVHAGLAGVRLKPAGPVTLNLDAEIGRADRPFFPISEKNYHALGARLQYKTKTVMLSAAARSNYNFNSAALSSHSARSRNYSLDASWTPREWFAIDAGYSKVHLDTLSGIAYFAGGSLVDGDRSVYVSNLHGGNLAARFAIGKRVDLTVGYNRVEDAGGDRPRVIIGVISPTPPDPASVARGAFSMAESYPLAFESPLARLSVRLHNKLRWNFGYQFYRYREDFFPGAPPNAFFRSAPQDYRAHTGYSSLLWSF